MSSQTITLDGISYYTLLEHPPSPYPSPSSPSPYILLIHATMSNLHMWDTTIPLLHSLNYSTLRIDHAGHHLSPPPTTHPQPFTIDTITNHFHTLAHQIIPYPPSAIIGCSIGGVVALRYGMLFPEDKSQIISVCGPGYKAPDGFKELWAGRAAMYKEDVEKGSERLMQITVNRWFPGDEMERDRKAREVEIERVKGCSLLGYQLLTGAVADFDYTGDVERMRGGGRVWVVAGGRDPSCDVKKLREVADGIGGARFELLEDAGHLPPVNDDEGFNRLLGKVFG